MDTFDLSTLATRRQESGKLYFEFLRRPSLSIGLYELPAGGIDPQQPHGEDEVYFVAAGRGSISVGREDSPVGPGSIVFVAAGVDHRFHDITEDLSLLVFFAPPEYSNSDRL